MCLKKIVYLADYETRKTSLYVHMSILTQPEVVTCRSDFASQKQPDGMCNFYFLHKWRKICRCTLAIIYILTLKMKVKVTEYNICNDVI